MKYLDLASAIERAIKEGAYLFGQKLPSVRACARAKGVSVATAIQAYRVLESRDIVAANPRSGHYVIYVPPKSRAGRQRFSNVSRSLKHFNDLMPELLGEAEAGPLIRLGLSKLEPDLVAREELKRISRGLLRENDNLLLEYPPPHGLAALRQRLCGLMQDRGVTLGPDDILVTSGCQEALWIALMCAAENGDTIALESPCYPGLLKIIQAMNLKAVEIPAYQGAGIDLDRLKAALKSHDIAAIAVAPNCGNPTGHVYSEENKIALVELAAASKTTIIEDDSNRDLYFGRQSPPALKAYDDKGIVFFCSSVSKTISPAFRIGWMVSGDNLEKAASLKYALSLATSPLSQLVVERFISSGGYGRQITRAKTVLADTMQRLLKMFKTGMPEVEIEPPRGGSLVWIGFNRDLDSLVLRQSLLNRGISIAPGALFSPSNAYKSYIRLGWGGALGVLRLSAL